MNNDGAAMTGDTMTVAEAHEFVRKHGALIHFADAATKARLDRACTVIRLDREAAAEARKNDRGRREFEAYLERRQEDDRKRYAYRG